MKPKRGGLSPKLVIGAIALVVVVFVLRGRGNAVTPATVAAASTPTEFVSSDTAALANLSQQLGTLSQQLNAPAAAAASAPGPTVPGWQLGPRIRSGPVLSGPF